VIAKVVRGYRPGGLVAYLFGPGRAEEHRNPRVVASWDGAPWLHQPDKLHSVALDGELLPAGEFDFDLRQLVRTMQGPMRSAGVPTGGLATVSAEWAALLRSGKRLSDTAPGWLRHYVYDQRKQAVVARPGPVWHCSVRLHPDDPTLTDEQWQHIAERLMQAVGIHQAGCRWIAVRHADDHIHLMATLVSETSGKRFHPYRDYPKLRTACQQLEREFGLVATASADKTAAPAPTRAEKAKAARLGRTSTVREELRHQVRLCAATTQNGPDFLAALADAWLSPRTVRDARGKVLGYTVSLPSDRAATGSQIRYSGAQLAPDLTWPKLLTRWADIPPTPKRTQRYTPTERRHILEQCARSVTRATAALKAGHDGDDVAHAAGELLTLLGRGIDRYAPGQLTALATAYDRAARTPYHVVPVSGTVARELRHAARQLGALGSLLHRSHQGMAAAALTLALASLIAEIAAWQHQRGRTHQAAVARATARSLPALAAQLPTQQPAALPAPEHRATQPGIGLTARPRAHHPVDPRTPGRHR
jgi:hypothetical protein